MASFKTWRGSPSKGPPAGRRTSQNIRATAFWRGRQGRIEKVAGSGIATMSLSSRRAKPSTVDPSNAIPCSSAPSSSASVMANPFRLPRMSVNQSRMNLTSFSFALRRTYWRASSSCPLAVTGSSKTGAGKTKHRGSRPGGRGGIVGDCETRVNIVCETPHEPSRKTVAPWRAHVGTPPRPPASPVFGACAPSARGTSEGSHRPIRTRLRPGAARVSWARYVRARSAPPQAAPPGP